MSEKIEPALTPEEWERVPIAPPVSLFPPGVCDLIDVQMGGVAGGEEIKRDLGAHALAALALHGQPFGFTWEDVDVLRRVSHAYDLAIGRGVFDEITARHSSVADRIASLLPPREEP